MSETDPVLVRLSELAVPRLDPLLTARIDAAARQRFVPRRLGAVWSLLVSVSVVTYLAWALVFTSRLLER
jgi:hypothetical protein